MSSSLILAELAELPIGLTMGVGGIQYLPMCQLWPWEWNGMEENDGTWHTQRFKGDNPHVCVCGDVFKIHKPLGCLIVGTISVAMYDYLGEAPEAPQLINQGL